MSDRPIVTILYDEHSETKCPCGSYCGAREDIADWLERHEPHSNGLITEAYNASSWDRFSGGTPPKSAGRSVLETAAGIRKSREDEMRYHEEWEREHGEAFREARRKWGGAYYAPIVLVKEEGSRE